MNNENIVQETTNPPVDIYVKKTNDTYVIVPDATDDDSKGAQYKVITNNDGSPKSVVDLSIPKTEGGKARRIRKTKKSRGGKARRFKSRRH